MGSNKPFVTEKPPATDRNSYRKDDSDDKSPRLLFHAIDQVHAEHRGDKRRNHHDDGDGGQRTHHGVHIVVDDTLISIHRRLQDVRIDAGRLTGLTHLDVDVLDKVSVKFVDLQFELQFRQQRLVTSDRRDEVGQRVLQTAQADERLIVHLTVQVALGLVDEHRDLLQALQIPDGTGEEQAEDHIDMVGEALTPLLLERHKVDHHVRFVEADGDGDVALMDDTKRDGGLRCPRTYLLDVWDTEDDEHPAVVVLITGTLIGIADVRHEVVGDIELLFEFVLVFFGGACHLYPAIGLPL